MKMNDRLMAILKNFATINPSLTLVQGKKQRTSAIARNIVVDALLEEDIPSDACIYDLPRFLNTVSMFKDPEIEFGTDSFVITDGSQRIRYTYADPSMVKSIGRSEVNLPDGMIEVSITSEQLAGALKAAGVLGLPEIAIEGKDGMCRLTAFNKDNPTSDQFSLDIGSTDRDFKAIFKPESLKLIPDDYEVSLAKNITRFKSKDMTYYVAIEKDSNV